MPRAKPLRSYPNAEYGALWARVARTREDVVLPMDRSRAMSLRAEFYGWARQARAAHAPDVMALGIDLGSLDDVRMTIAPDGLKLYHKENAVGVAEIRALLGPGLERPVAPEVVEPAVAAAKELTQDEMDAIFEPGNIVKRIREATLAREEKEQAEARKERE